MSKSTAAPAPEATTDAPTLVHVDPATLVLATNVRTDARLDAGFLASIRERGVLVPVVAHRTADGALAVLMGQRRTLAAVETARPTVPVLVVADLAEADRLVDQMGENDHRTALTTGERVAGFAQLAALGVSAAQIAKRTATKRVDVDAALTVAASGIATGAADRYDFLTLDQSATLADFEDEPDTITALVVAARDGQFDHVAQRARDARALRRQGEEVAADLAARGVPVVERPGYDEPASPLSELKHDGEPLTGDNHAQCPGHAAYIRPVMQWVDTAPTEPAEPVEDEPTAEDLAEADSLADPAEDDEEVWYDDDGEAVWDTPTTTGGSRERVETMVATYVCTDPQAHGHAPRWGGTTGASTRTAAADMSDEEREQAKAERRDVIESNRAWKSAEVVRRDWLRTFAARKTAPKDTPQFIAAALAGRNYSLTKAIETGHALACDLLGATSGGGYGRRPALVDDKTTGPRAQVITLVLLLAAVEESTGTHSWRNVSQDTAGYLRFIEANGYSLSDVERRACGEEPLPVEPATTAEPVRLDEPDEEDQADEARDDVEDTDDTGDEPGAD